jgi:hypothetical protein
MVIKKKLKDTCQRLYEKCVKIAPEEDLTEFYIGSQTKQKDGWYEDWQERLEDIIFANTK